MFEKDLTPLLQRAHEGATHHVGKVPTRRGGTGVPMKRQVDVAKLRKELARAVEAEDYERAAKLRDQIRQAEGIGAVVSCQLVSCQMEATGCFRSATSDYQLSN